jgi:hypothetical protein
VYEKLDKELLTYVEDVLLNRRPDSTERMMEYAATLDPKSHPTKLRKLAGESNAPVFQAKLNPIPAGFNPVALPDVLPPVPEYKPWVDPLAKSVAFEQLEKLFEERIAYIDGAMGTMIQRYKLQVWLPQLFLDPAVLQTLAQGSLSCCFAVLGDPVVGKLHGLDRRLQSETVRCPGGRIWDVCTFVMGDCTLFLSVWPSRTIN